MMGVVGWFICFDPNLDGEKCTAKWVIFVRFMTFISTLVVVV